MAVLENREYIRILPEECCVDDYVHVCFIKYKYKEHRLREKKIEEKFINFRQKAYEELSKMEESEKLDKLYAVLEDIENTYIQHTFDDVVKIDLNLDEITFFETLGFEKDWCKNPILIYPKCNVYCGTYNNEIVDSSFYYVKLKSTMNDEIIEDI